MEKRFIGIHKDGAIKMYVKAPKRLHIIETIEIKEGVWKHHFSRSDGKQERDFVSCCGYDRGPKRTLIVTKLLGI